MKRLTTLSLSLALLSSTATYAQLGSRSGTGDQSPRVLQYFRPAGKAGLNMFETPKADTVAYEGLEVVVGGDFAIIFQGLDQSNLNGDLVELANNFTLPTANLNLDVQLEEGVRLHLRTYLSSRHHPEAWVKGGYVQIDELDFIREGLLSSFMNVATVRFGMDEINYGDMHFRRSDNARSIYNPFVANYIMDAFTTEPFAELTLQQSGWLGVAGISNGRLNQSPVEGDGGLALYGKLGYDKQLSPDFCLRLTGSVYHSTEGGTRDYLYGGDRAGSRYYKILEVAGEERPSDFLPRFNPGFNYLTALQFNPFVKFQGLEFFGILERTVNGNDAAGGDFNQYGAELIYRFGSSEQLYVAGRYNWVEGQATDTNAGIEISRSAAAAGWFITPNMLLKAEYVSSFYNGTDFLTRQNQPDMRFWDADYSGFVAEAVISF